jgi:hypothetical protein
MINWSTSQEDASGPWPTAAFVLGVAMVLGVMYLYLCPANQDAHSKPGSVMTKSHG